MENVDFEVLKVAADWSLGSRPAWLGTVVRTWGSAPRPIGSMMALRADGHVRGSVSGGCVEDDLIAKMHGGGLSAAAPFTLTYGASAEEAHRFGLPCGGTLQIVMEPLSPAAQLEPLLAMIRQCGRVTRQLDMHSGAVRLTPGAVAPDLRFDGATLSATFGPRYRLLIVGAAQASRYTAQFAGALGYDVTVCDPRDEYLDEWDVPGVTLSREMPDDLIVSMRPDVCTAIVTLTHDPKLDDMALLEALKSPAFYVGAIGSRSNNARRRERLALFDLSADEIDRLHGPVGLHIGARTPPEIALSILAEMTAIRSGAAASRREPVQQPETSSGCLL